MKRLLFILAAFVLLLVGSNFYYAHQAKKHLDTLANTLRMMGGNLEYRDLGITLGGRVEIEDLRIKAPGSEENLNLGLVSLHTGSIIGIHKLAMDVRKNRFPEQLGLSFEGVQVVIGGEAYKQIHALDHDYPERFLLAGCGERTSISDADLVKMGYGDFVSVSSHLEYRLMNKGQWVEMESKTTIDGMNEIAAKVDISLNATSRDMAALGSAMGNAKLHELVVEYNDQGYFQRLLDLCHKESGLPRMEFLDRHMEAWKQAWLQRGFVAGENLVTAYRRFIEQPEQFRISAKPNEDIGLTEFANVSPELLPYQFASDLQVNGVAAGRLDVTVWEESGKNQEKSRLVTMPGLTPTATGEKIVTIEVGELRNYLNQQVILRLSNGRTLEGKIVQLSDDGLQIQSYQTGGKMTIPVTYAQIEEARAK